MLSRHDADLAARDPALPGLALLLDAERLAARLAASLPEAGIIGATPTYLRYKPGTSCIQGLRLHLTTGGEVQAYAKAYEAGHYAIMRERLEPLRHPTAFGTSRILIDDALVALRLLPNDRELKNLHHLADEQGRARLLQRLLVAAPWLAEGTVLEPIRYKPERRFVARLLRGGEPVAIIKAYGKREFAPALAGAAVGVAVGGQPLLGALARRRVLAVGWVHGTPLCAVGEGAPTLAGMRAAGEALARVHMLDLDLPSIRSREDEAAGLLEVAHAVGVICPDLGEGARRLAASIADDLRAAPLRPRLLHGDFSADQVVQAADGSLTFIDWDNAAAGDAAADLGSFIARLEADALEHGSPDSASASDAFRDGYAQLLPLPRTADLQVAAELLRLATEPFRRRLPEWPRRMTALLYRVAALHQPARHWSAPCVVTGVTP
jgi:hypothetical protein